TIAVTEVNARNLRGIVKDAKGCQLIVNASASVFNQIVLRAALRLRSHYLDLSSHLTRNPFKAEQLRYTKRFEEKNRAAVINAGAAPGLTNLLVKRAADMLDEVRSVHIRLYESSESEDPISQWSPEVSFDEAVSHPRVYRNGRFELAKRFSEIEKFRFPDPIGAVRVVLAAQDEAATLPYFIPIRDLEVKIGGNEIDRLRRWHRQGKLSKSRGMARQRFPQTFSPKRIAKLIRQGILQNPLPNQLGNSLWGKCLGETLPRHSPRLRQFSLPVPTAQAVNLVSADFYLQIPDWDEVRQRGCLVLRREHHAN